MRIKIFLIPTIISFIILLATAGYFYWPSIKTFQTNSHNQTANWKTYINTKHGYSFKYPTNYRLESCHTCFDINNTDYVNITSPQYSYQNQGYSIIASWSIQTDINKITSLKKTKVGNRIEAYTKLVTRYGDEEKYVYVIIDNGVLEFSYNSFKNEGGQIKNLKDSTLFDQVLSTFKFLDVAPTPTCRPRPACLDSTPKCLIPETSDMCPSGR